MGLLLLVPMGCGTPCQQIRDERAGFLARDRGVDDPHLSIALPFALVNRLLAEHLDELPSVPVPSPVGGKLKRYLGQIELVPRSLTLQPAPDGVVGLRLTLGVSYRGADLVDMTTDLQLRPKLDHKGRRLRLAIRADDLRDLRPRITEDGAERLAQAIRRQVPSAARRLIPAKTFGSAANKILDRAVSQAYAALRDGALRELGRVAEISLALPDVPVADLRISSTGGPKGAMHLGVVTSLPVRQGLRSRAGAPASASDAALLRVSGACMAELANWAIAEGKIPARYDDKGRPDAKGPFEVGLDWRTGPRPLKVQLWNLADPCIQARLGGTPSLRVAGDKLKVAAKDIKLEELRGPALYEFGAFFYALSGPTFDVAEELAKSFRIKVGSGKALTFVLASAGLKRDEVVLGVARRQKRP